MKSKEDYISLKWSDFQTNIPQYFHNERRDGDYCDVTLACEGEELVEAHRVILAAGISFFQNILRETITGYKEC